jgi:cytochrome P450
MSADPFALLDPAFFTDPYPTYARIREKAPVHFSEPWAGWLLVRYEDVASALRDRRFSAQRSGTFAARLSAEMRERLSPVAKNLASWALMMDAPDHTRVRALMNKGFSPRVVEGSRARIAELARELVDAALATSDTVDVVATIANALPVLVIGELLGLPQGDRHLLKGWSDALAAFLGAVSPSEAVVTNACSAIVELEAYFRDALAARRRAPTDDALSALCRAEEDGILLSDQELVSTCSMLLFAGHETTTNLIGSGLYALLRHPDEMARLRRAPEAISTAVDEFLRFESPIQRVGRVLKENVSVGGVEMRAGDRAHLVMGAANRDPAAFPDPDRLDVLRKSTRNVAFGLGAHYCVGASLGRMEAELALGELLRRSSAIELAEVPTWHPNAALRGLSALRVRIA